MSSCEQILETAANGGSIDLYVLPEVTVKGAKLTTSSDEWPRVLEHLLKRLHDIVHTDFPIPSVQPPRNRPALIDPEVVASTPPPLPANDSSAQEQSYADTDTELATNSQGSSKENDTPADIALTKRERTKLSAQAPPQFEVASSQRTEEILSPCMPMESDQNALPPELLDLYQSSTRILQNDFAHSPPYTIQRLSEMILQPKRHYRYLSGYLRAIDRIVSVSSPISDFPLPILHASSASGFLTNGELPVNGIAERESLGSDESLGGALLTPIPWLQKENHVLNPSLAPSGHAEGADVELYAETEQHNMDESVAAPGAGPTMPTGQNSSGSGSAGAGAGGGAGGSFQPHSSPITSPTLSEQSDASTSSASSTEVLLQQRENGAVTQGELLRQEQEAGVVPVDSAGNPMTPRKQQHFISSSGGALAVGREPIASSSSSSGSGIGGVNPSAIAGAASAPGAPPDLPLEDDASPIPHARGPNVIGMEDTGPQPEGLANAAAGTAGVTVGTIDLEAAVGRGRDKSPQPTTPAAAPTVETTVGPVAKMEKGGAGKGDDDDDEMEGISSGAEGKDVDMDMSSSQGEERKGEGEVEAEVKDGDGDVVVGDADSGGADGERGGK